MFANYAAAKNRKMPKWAVPLIGAAVIFHIALFLTMWIKTIWEIEQLERPKTSIDLAVAPPPPPPPPPPPGGAKPQEVQITPKKIKVKDIVQPVKIEKQQVQKVEDTGDPNGVEGGVEGGVAGGVVGGDLNGVMGAPPPPPPPPPPPVRCRVPRVLGLRLGAAKRKIRAAHCSVGSVRRAQASRLPGEAGGRPQVNSAIKGTGRDAGLAGVSSFSAEAEACLHF